MDRLLGNKGPLQCRFALECPTKLSCLWKLPEDTVVSPWTVGNKAIRLHQTHCHDHFAIFTQHIFKSFKIATRIEKWERDFITEQTKFIIALTLRYLTNEVLKIYKQCFVWSNLMWCNLWLLFMAGTTHSKLSRGGCWVRLRALQLSIYFSTSYRHSSEQNHLFEIVFFFRWLFIVTTMKSLTRKARAAAVCDPLCSTGNQTARQDKLKIAVELLAGDLEWQLI